MDIPIWIIVVGVVVVVLYLVTMRGFFRQSKEVDRKTDFSKIPPLKDEDE